MWPVWRVTSLWIEVPQAAAAKLTCALQPGAQVTVPIAQKVIVTVKGFPLCFALHFPLQRDPHVLLLALPLALTVHRVRVFVPGPLIVHIYLLVCFPFVVYWPPRRERHLRGLLWLSA